MSIWNGSMGIRFFYIPGETKADNGSINACLAGHTIPAMGEIIDQADGWSGPDGLLDRDLRDEHVAAHGEIRLNLVHAEKRISESMLAALVSLECKAWMRVSGSEVIPRGVRAEIKDAIRKRLMKETSPAIDGMGVWVNLRERTVAAEATTDSKIDRLSPMFREAFGVYPVALTPETAAFQIHGLSINDVAPCSYSFDADAPVETDLGMEFLTWLFWKYDKTGGEFRITLHGPMYGYMLEGPLTFWREGQGSHEVTIRKGSPLTSREAAVCLRSGKLLSKARFVMVQDASLWTCSVDHTFAFTALKLPPAEAFDPDEKMAERSLRINMFLEAWLALYGQFIELRRDSVKWSVQAGEMAQWISAKSGCQVAS